MIPVRGCREAGTGSVREEEEEGVERREEERIVRPREVVVNGRRAEDVFKRGFEDEDEAEGSRRNREDGVERDEGVGAGRSKSIEPDSREGATGGFEEIVGFS